jgi:hypothetical protein
MSSLLVTSFFRSILLPIQDCSREPISLLLQIDVNIILSLLDELIFWNGSDW